MFTSEDDSNSMLTKIIKWLLTAALFVYFAWSLGEKVYRYREELNVMKGEAIALWPNYLLCLVLFWIAMFIRGHRWALSMGDVRLTWSCYRSTAIAYLVQCPLSKLGEVVRMANQKKYSKVGLGSIVSTVFVDRLTDVLALGALLIVTSWVSQGLIQEHFPQIGALMPKLVIMMVLGFVGILAVVFLQEKAVNLLSQQAFLPEKLTSTLVGFIQQFSAGLEHSRKWGMLMYFLFSTLGIWGIYFVCFYVSIAFYPQLQLNGQDLVILFAVATLGAIIPVPGGMAYPVFLEQGLLLVSPELSPAIALSLSLLLYLINFWLVNLICGGITWLFQVVAVEPVLQTA